MSTFLISTRRLIVAGGFTPAVAAAPAVTMVAVAHPPHVAPLAACTPGEEEDVYTTVCTPYLVPNSPSGLTPIPGNPDIPEIDGIPCTGHDSGACIGLSEEQQAEGPQPVPRSTISASP
jgi:hypothetical protein